MAGEMLEMMLEGDEAKLKMVVGRVTEIIQKSFIADGSRVTGDEVRRRFTMLEKLIRECREEYGWAYERILDVIPFALRSRLDGGVWDPQLHRNSWSTEV